MTCHILIPSGLKPRPFVIVWDLGEEERGGFHSRLTLARLST